MKILLMGSGGREHALALKLNEGGPVELFIAPGSDGLAQLGTCLPLGVEDVAGVVAWCQANHPDLVVVGPEAPLVVGLADALKSLKIPVFGHDQATARLEGSKAFAKDFMERHAVACAKSFTVQSLEMGEKIIREWAFGYPVVLKADGLAAGKGVVLAKSQDEALATLRSFMAGQFGDASRTVVLEEPLIGMELSLHVLVDVTKDRAECMILPACQDHKRIFEGDEGPNTGGMGAFGPIPFLTPENLARMDRELVQPTLKGLQVDGLDGRGVLFLGVMWTPQGPKLLEYNVRFGDPETQVLMQLLDENLPELLLQVARHEFKSRAPRLHDGCAMTVVLAAEDYPEGAKKGVAIEIGDLEKDITLIHAGTRKDGNAWFTNGGRVMNLVGRAHDLEKVREKLQKAVSRVNWPGMQVRRDIGLKALTHFQSGKGF